MAANHKSTNKRSSKTQGSRSVAKTKSSRSGSTLKKIIKNVKNAVKLASTTSTKLPALEKISKVFNKSTLIGTLAERTQLNKKQISQVINELLEIIKLHLKKGGPEKFIMPGAFKIVVKKVAAKKARSGVNPFTGEPTVFKAKPATRKVKIIALKTLKDMAV